MELFNDLNVGWRHLLWAETSGHQDYPFKSDLPYGYVFVNFKATLFFRIFAKKIIQIRTHAISLFPTF